MLLVCDGRQRFQRCSFNGFAPAQSEGCRESGRPGEVVTYRLVGLPDRIRVVVRDLVVVRSLDVDRLIVVLVHRRAVRSKVFLDIDQTGLHQDAHDCAGFEHGETALAREIRDAALAVDLAQQRPRVGVECDVSLAAMGSEHRHGVGAMDRIDDFVPGRLPNADLVEQLVQGGRRCYVLAGLFALPETPATRRPGK
ncbi:MAG TPA: hypothetical protein VFG00_05145 [Acidothermaceae bacterium]|nr:hypothetical protein [Acidothermaceae bacterium]